MKLSTNSRYFLTVSYIFMLIYKVLIAGQYLCFAPNHHPILFFPPFSLVLAASDFILIFVFFKICDLFNKFKLLDKLYWALFVVAGAFLIYDFALFQYFRGFNNLGLAIFMAFGVIEDIVTYFLSSLNSFFTFTALLWIFFAVLAFIFVFKRKFRLIKPFSDRVVQILLIVNVVFFFVLQFFPFEEKVGLEKSPLFEYFSTRILSSYYLDVDKETEKAEYPEIADEDETFPKIDFDYSQTKGKNIILVILESTAFEKTPIGGDKESEFLFLTELSKKSLNFVSHRTVFPATTRSVLSLFCSNYVGTDYESITRTGIPFDCVSVFDLFRKNGYSTSFFSPVLLDFDDFGNAEAVKRIEYVFEPSEVIRNGSFKRKFGTQTAIEEEIVQADFSGIFKV